MTLYLRAGALLCAALFAVTCSATPELPADAGPGEWSLYGGTTDQVCASDLCLAGGETDGATQTTFYYVRTGDGFTLYGLQSPVDGALIDSAPLAPEPAAPAALPEPASALLVAAGLIVAGAIRRRTV